jgi:large subunit ribosomal protein L3
MKSLIAKKVNMTQIFADNGVVTPVTVLALGAAEDAQVFAEGEAVQVTGTSKGKGFQGVVKRHGFHGGPRSHGQKHSEREPGSISGGTRNGGRVPAGMRMAGRMGGDKITVKNLTIMKVLPEENAILVSGAVPGRRGSKVILLQK